MSASRGIGVRDGDVMMLKAGTCSGLKPALNSNKSGISAPANDGGRIYKFGTFNLSTSPGAYSKCWCRPTEQKNCSDTTHFIAESGLLNLHCPAGYFAVGSHCKPCTRGYYCHGMGMPKQACPRGRTTPNMGARSSEDCQCLPGHELEVRTPDTFHRTNSGCENVFFRVQIHETSYKYNVRFHRAYPWVALLVGSHQQILSFLPSW